MEIIKDAIAYISEEWAMISSAPVTFITVVALIGIVIWYFIRLVHKGEIASLKAAIVAQDERIALSKDGLEQSQRRFAELEIELVITRETISTADSVAMQHFLAALTLASDVRINLDSAATVLTLPAHLLPQSGRSVSGTKTFP